MAEIGLDWEILHIEHLITGKDGLNFGHFKQLSLKKLSLVFIILF